MNASNPDNHTMKITVFDRYPEEDAAGTTEFLAPLANAAREVKEALQVSVKQCIDLGEEYDRAGLSVTVCGVHSAEPDQVWIAHSEVHADTWDKDMGHQLMCVPGVRLGTETIEHRGVKVTPLSDGRLFLQGEEDDYGTAIEVASWNDWQSDAKSYVTGDRMTYSEWVEGLGEELFQVDGNLYVEKHELDALS